MAIIIGIDPGTYVTGFGVLRKISQSRVNTKVEHISHGVILLSKDSSLADRLKVLSIELKQIFSKYKPDAVIVEKIFMGKNADSAFKLGHARGVVLSEAAQANAEVFEYATRVIKKGIAGKGSADKESVQFMIEKILNLKKIERLDASDALALALYHGQRI